MAEFGVAQTEDGFTVSSNVLTSEQVAEQIAEPSKPAPKALEGAAEPTAAGTETETPEGETRAPEGKHKPKSAIERMKEATSQAAQLKREKAEIQRERDEIARRDEENRRELESLRASLGKNGEPRGYGGDSAREADKEPSLDDFESVDAYVSARVKFEIERDRKSAIQNRAKEIVEQSKAERFSQFEKQIKVETEKDPEFLDKISQDVINLRPLSVLGPDEPRTALNVLAEQFLVSDMAPRLMMYFTEHPDELRRFSALHPLRFGVELGKIEERLGTATTATVPLVEISKAKPPVRPVTGGPTTGDKPPSDEASFEEHAAYWDAQERKNARR